jgi:hypothetical protein
MPLILCWQVGLTPMKKPEQNQYHAWNPGLTSNLPSRLLPQVTLFRPENSHIGYAEAKEAADFCGLAVEQLCALRVERLVVHELLIRVTADLSVPDGPSYEYLGLQLRGMVDRIYRLHMTPRMLGIATEFNLVCSRAEVAIRALLDTALSQTSVARKPAKGIFERFFHRETKPVHNDGVRDQAAIEHIASAAAGADEFEAACISALLAILNGIMGKQGKLVADRDLIIKLALRVFRNDYGSRAVGRFIAPFFAEAAEAEGYRFLPAQRDPIVMNTKGASAAGKSTIRPKQRLLAEKMGIPWEDFALISPDYWRKYLLDYDSVGADYKYAAMLTGRELEFVDKKLDLYMAEKAINKTVPHLLIDRFRFDSFKVDSEGDYKSTLLSRFGSTVFLFFTITPPAETVERAWQRGLSTARYKAVDDLLYHNIEAFNGIPQLFFSWMAIKDKKIYFEFLDNDVPLGDLPRTIAFGRNDWMTILDPEALSNIDRFKEVNVGAIKASEVLDPNWTHTYHFLQQCKSMFPNIEFADHKTAGIYGRVRAGQWYYKNQRALPVERLSGSLLEAIGWSETPEPKKMKVERIDVLAEKRVTLGAWGNDAK